MCVVKNSAHMYQVKYAGVAELADALDLGSSVSDMQVRPLSPAPKRQAEMLAVLTYASIY